MSIKIEKGVPIPEKSLMRKTKYPFRKMDIGDSIYIECDKDGMKNAVMAAYQCAHRYGGRYVHQADEKGIRIWRAE